MNIFDEIVDGIFMAKDSRMDSCAFLEIHARHCSYRLIFPKESLEELARVISKYLEECKNED